MRNPLVIEDTVTNRISFYLLGGFLITLPFDRFYSQLALVAFLLHTLIHSRKQKARSFLSWQNLALVSVFLITLAGMAWSPDKGQAWKDLQRQLAILVFPIAFAVSDFPFARYREKLLTLFALGSVFTALYLYADAARILLYYDLPLATLFSPAFINHNFSSPAGIHATFLSLYMALSWVIMARGFAGEKEKKKRLIYLACLLILFAVLLQLASRSVLIALAVITACLPFFLEAGRQRRRFVLLAALLITVAAAGILVIGSFRERFVYELKDDLAPVATSQGLPEPRMVRWACVWELITGKLWLGYGSGTEKRLLQETYFEKKLFKSYLHELNSHNQYLSFWLKSGLAGLLVFLFTLGYGFYRARKARDLLLFAFLVLMAVVSFSENILDVNKGIFFYAFFFSFFLFSGKPRGALSRLVSNKNP